MIRITHVSLPPGLNALARRGPDDELSVYVSDALPPNRQRAAVQAALRASRPSGWRPALLPVPSLALLLAASAAWLHRAATALRTQWAAWATATAVVAAGSAAVYLAVAPHGHGPVTAARPPAASTSQPAPHPGVTTHPVPSRRPASAPAAAPQAGPRALATVATRPTPAPGTSPPPVATPSPRPTPTTSPTPPQPSPSPTARGGRHCIKILGIRVCVGVGT